MCGSMLVGNILYGLAYYANWLYLILIGRMVCGLGYTVEGGSELACDPRRQAGKQRFRFERRHAGTPVSARLTPAAPACTCTTR